ncbi:MAG TPA: hypothetical protein VF525_01435 [Pyrinomonadaceae bacterium]|jgi:hypothetical protein
MKARSDEQSYCAPVSRKAMSTATVVVEEFAALFEPPDPTTPRGCIEACRIGVEEQLEPAHTQLRTIETEIHAATVGWDVDAVALLLPRRDALRLLVQHGEAQLAALRVELQGLEQAEQLQHDQASRADAVPIVNDMPAIVELWRWRLVTAVAAARASMQARQQHGGHKPEDAYDHHWLYAHQDKLQDKSQIQSASDDVLLEAVSLPTVQRWGWLHFMVRDLNWFTLIAYNWNLSHLAFEYGSAAYLSPATGKVGVDWA